MRPLTRLLFGSAALEPDRRAELAAEGVAILAEDLPGSITYRNFRAPGRRSSYRKTPIRGGVAITDRRLLVWVARAKNTIDVPLDDPRLAAIEVTTDRPDRVCFTFDPAVFRTDWSGTMEVRLRTPQAPQIAELLTTRH